MNRRIKKKFSRKLKYNDLSAETAFIVLIGDLGVQMDILLFIQMIKVIFYMVVVKKNSMRVISLQSN